MPERNEPMVGVVTPVYNGARYIRECLESVLAQTHENWEHVVCDNASTDETAEIVEEFANRDSRIRLERNDDDHVGFLHSWNRAAKALPEGSAYCKVLHADDRMHPECIQRMVEVGERHPSVGVVGAFRLSGARVTLHGLSLEEEVVPGRELCRRLLLGELTYVFGSPSSTMLRADLVRKRADLYDTTFLHADSVACYDLLQESDFGFVHQVLTYTRLHSEAMTSYTIRMGSYRPEHLRMLVRYGPACLSEEQYRLRLAAAAGSYARVLAKRTHRWREPEYREFHKRQLGYLRSDVAVEDLTAGIGLQVRRRIPFRGDG